MGTGCPPQPALVKAGAGMTFYWHRTDETDIQQRFSTSLHALPL